MKIIILFILLISLISFISAIPGIPHQFYGNVMVNGMQADNNIIVAVIGGKNYSTITKEGLYGIAPDAFFVEDPNGQNAEKEINFYIGRKKAGTYTFKNNELTKLNFSLSTKCGDSYCLGEETCLSCFTDCGTCKTPPEIFIESPKNKIYNTFKIDVDVYSDQNILIWMYSLNSEVSQIFNPNITMTLNDGDYELRIIAINEAYQINSKTISFSVDIPYNYCGDGTCNNGESCSICPDDCGACPTPPSSGGGSSGGGGGGGGGGGSPIKTNTSSTNKTNTTSTNSFSSGIESINEKEENETDKNFFSGITGAVISFGENLGNFKQLIVIMFIAGIPILLFILIKNRRKRKNISDY